MSVRTYSTKEKKGEGKGEEKEGNEMEGAKQ